MEGGEVEDVVDGASGHADDLEDPLVGGARLRGVVSRKEDVAVGIDCRLRGDEQ